MNKVITCNNMRMLVRPSLAHYCKREILSPMFKSSGLGGHCEGPKEAEACLPCSSWNGTSLVNGF